MCLSKHSESTCCRNYDDHTSKHFNRFRIEAELLNFFDEKSCGAVSSSSQKEDNDQSFECDELQPSECQLMQGTPRNVDQLTSRCFQDNSDLSVSPLEVSERSKFDRYRQNLLHEDSHPQSGQRYRVVERGNIAAEDYSHGSTLDLFQDGYLDDNDSLDPLMFTLYLEDTDCDESIMSWSSRISYDESENVHGSIYEQELHEDGLSIANESHYVAGEKRLLTGSSTFSSTNTGSGFDENIMVDSYGAEDESQTVFVVSKGSSKFTTDSPKILELREKKRLMERSYEKKYSKFPALIEVDDISPSTYCF